MSAILDDFEVMNYQCEIARRYFFQSYSIDEIYDGCYEPNLDRQVRGYLDSQVAMFTYPYQLGEFIVYKLDYLVETQTIRSVLSSHIKKVNYRATLIELLLPRELNEQPSVRDLVIEKVKALLKTDPTYTCFVYQACKISHEQERQIKDAANSAEWGNIPTLPTKEGMIFL